MFTRIPLDNSITIYYERMRQTGKHPYMFWPSLFLHHQGASTFRVRTAQQQCQSQTQGNDYSFTARSPSFVTGLEQLFPPLAANADASGFVGCFADDSQCLGHRLRPHLLTDGRQGGCTAWS